MRNLALPIAFALSTACSPAPKSEPAAVESSATPAALSAEDEAAIRAVDAEWGRAASAGDAAALTALYASDATLLPPGEPIAKGEAMKKYNADMFKVVSGPFALTTTVVDGRGDLAFAVGSYRATLTPKQPGAKPMPTEEGKYVEVLQKQTDGSWKIIYDIWNPNTPPAKQ